LIIQYNCYERLKDSLKQTIYIRSVHESYKLATSVVSVSNLVVDSLGKRKIVQVQRY